MNVCCDKDDLYAQAHGKSKQDNVDFCKVTNSCPSLFQMTIGYGESEMKKLECRGRMQLSEHIDLRGPHKCVINVHPCIHVTSTSTQKDEIYQATVLSDLHKVLTHSKDIIFGNQENVLLPSEREADPQTDMVCVHHEKTVELYEKIIHHVDADVLVVGFPASGNIAIAMLNMGKRGILLARNDTHAEMLNERITQHILAESLKTNNEVTITRADVIDRLGLEPDARATADDSDGDGRRSRRRISCRSRNR